MTFSPEFNWSWDVSRRCWVIRRRGSHYLDIPWKDFTPTYVMRVTKMLNGEK